ncbi:HD domain-containing protein [bacterium]|nr:HD domain-containing protein [bacterium]
METSLDKVALFQFQDIFRRQFETDVKTEPFLALWKLVWPSIPHDFFLSPSSSTGNHHPAENNNAGGIVIHTLKAVEIGKHLMDLYGISGLEREIVLFSLYLHDICKYGFPWGKSTSKVHGITAADFLKAFSKVEEPALKRAFELISTHMDPWKGESFSPLIPGEDLLLQVLIQADYLASREKISFIPPELKGFVN